MLEGRREPGDAVALALRAVYEDLAACADLRPGPRVDAAFGRLVRLVLDVPAGEAPAVLAHGALAPVVGELRSLCFAGEYELELDWACRIASSPQPLDELERFPYIANYRQLAELERATVTRLAGPSPVAPGSRVAVVGSGPLPLTSFLLAADGVRVDNVERDGDALDRSRQVAAALAVDGLAFHQVDVGAGATGFDVAAYDLVVLAALVGLAPGRKAAVLHHLALAMAPGAVLLARSARGLRTLLYPEVAAEALAGFDVLGTVHPTGEVINSVILARKPGSPRRPRTAEER